MSTTIAAPPRRLHDFLGRKKVLTPTLVGTTIEWYDFFVYAQAAGLVFARCSSAG